MKHPILLLAFFVLSSCAQLTRPAGKTEYFLGESVHYTADGKTVVGQKGTFLLEFTLANDRSKIFEKRSYRDSQKGVVHADSTLERIGQSEGYSIIGPKGHVVGLMSYTNPERTNWAGEIYFDGGGHMTYTSVKNGSQGTTDSLHYGPDRKLMGQNKTVFSEISALEYEERMKDMKAAK